MRFLSNKDNENSDHDNDELRIAGLPERKNRIDAKNMPPGVQGGRMASNPEMMGNREPGNIEQLEFKPGRKPKEAIEGDMVRFLYSYVDSIYWLQGRLNSRIDSLETETTTNFNHSQPN